jgi:Alpha amylase, catalytic domain
MLDRFNNSKAPPRNLPYNAEFSQLQGGTYNGVREQLNYLQQLGVGAIWLSPVLKNPQFDEHTYHGYGVQNFLAVEPRASPLAQIRRKGSCACWWTKRMPWVSTSSSTSCFTTPAMCSSMSLRRERQPRSRTMNSSSRPKTVWRWFDYATKNSNGSARRRFLAWDTGVNVVPVGQQGLIQATSAG